MTIAKSLTTLPILVLLGPLAACSSLFGDSPPAGQQQAAAQEQSGQTAGGVQLRDGGLLAGRGGMAELGLSVDNTANQTRWLRVGFRTPGGSADCVQARELLPQVGADFFCPQPKGVQAGVDYAVQVEVYGDSLLTRKLETLNTVFRFTPADLAALKQAPGG
ncbi:MAG TPA: hypothetical protein VNN09_05245 [Candidatus Competibacteraceae bacterium]|nr:hypothetical protein [Candidatus Competibacteraceae bacterium]